jgi:methylmalonyl-CoA mutase
MKGNLFSDFEPVTAKQWKQKIQADLKGADYNETLLWKTNEGIVVKPFYHPDEYESLSAIKNNKDFNLCQTIFISEVKTANFLAKDALHRGATSLQFEAHQPFNVKLLLDKLDLPKKGNIYFKLNFLSESFITELVEKTTEFNIYLNIDLISNLARTGDWYYTSQQDHAVLENIFKISNGINILSVDSSLYQNSGASMVQQLAYTLAHVNEYLNYFKDKEVFSKGIGKSIQFNFAVGSNYFFEIAKLRAFRRLWKTLAEEYDIKTKAVLFVQPSYRNKTLYDFNVNLLRTTTECMSAMVGGADTIANISYDCVYHKKNEFGERIARNQLLILQHESYFKEAIGVADGSYYIEALTKQLAEKALDLFKDIEKSGGFVKQLIAGTIQRKIKESAQKEQSQFDKGEKVLLGTNKHPNLNDKMKEELELYPFVKINPRQTSIQPIIPIRLSDKIEQDRLAKE